MHIPYQQLGDDTLKSLLEEIITREGTDYGFNELTLDQKLEKAKAALQSGNAVIEYDVITMTCNLVLYD